MTSSNSSRRVISELCRQGDCRRCGGGLVRGDKICAHSCHGRIGRPALAGKPQRGQNPGAVA